MNARSRIYLCAALVLAGIGACSTGARASAGPVQPKQAVVVNVNTATEQQLMLLPGVGPKLANEIYTVAEGRDSKDSACDHRCHIKSLADLDAVKGIGPAKLRAMAPYVVFTGETTATSKIRVAKGGAK